MSELFVSFCGLAMPLHHPIVFFAILLEGGFEFQFHFGWFECSGLFLAKQISCHLPDGNQAADENDREEDLRPGGVWFRILH